MNNNRNPQYYRLTLDEALIQYKKGWITATALLYYYLKIRLAPGWKCTLHQREITQHLGIPKTSFYRAIENLGREGLINWEAPNGVVIVLPATESSFPKETEFPTEDSSPRNETQSHQWDSIPTDGTESSTNGTGSSINGTDTLVKPLSHLASSDPPYSYQIFINSLSDRVREKFFTFVREKIKSFTTPINDIEGWLAASNQAGQERWRVYYAMFQTEVKDVIAYNQDWANHPQREEWIEQIRLGKPRFIALGGPDSEREQRIAFADWAITRQLVWGTES